MLSMEGEQKGIDQRSVGFDPFLVEELLEK